MNWFSCSRHGSVISTARSADLSEFHTGMPEDGTASPRGIPLPNRCSEPLIPVKAHAKIAWSLMADMKSFRAGLGSGCASAACGPREGAKAVRESEVERVSNDGSIGSSAQGAAKRPSWYMALPGRWVGLGMIGLARRRQTTRPSDAHEMTASSSIGSV